MLKNLMIGMATLALATAAQAAVITTDTLISSATLANSSTATEMTAFETAARVDLDDSTYVEVNKHGRDNLASLFAGIYTIVIDKPVDYFALQFGNGSNQVDYFFKNDAAVKTMLTFTGANIDNRNIADLSGYVTVDAAAAKVPEPASLALMGMGLAGFMVARRRKAA